MIKKVITTLHIPQKVHGRFKELVSSQKEEMSTVVEQLMTKWVAEHEVGARTDRLQMDHAVKLLTRAVCDQLTNNDTWATEALVGAGMGLPGSSVFSDRIGHFSDEKQELGKLLAHWMLRRSLNFIDKGRPVFLVCDSGTTVFWFLKAFGEAISEYFTATGRKTRLKDLVIVTNNIPGAESFVTYASLHSVNLSSGDVRISDMVDCRILAGMFLPEYVAITGDDTDLDLENYAKKARNQSKGKSGKNAPPVFIAITTGNWITVQGAEGSAIPYFFARGRGHGAFKKKLLEVCDESFALAPLGKVLLGTTVKDFNEKLGYSADAANPQEQSYELVPTPSNKAKVIKLVSTIRQRQSVLRDHSALLCKKIGRYSILDRSELTMAQTLLPIQSVDHLLFPFDQFSEETSLTQLEMELPHKKTRNDAFKRDLFSIRAQSQ